MIMPVLDITERPIVLMLQSDCGPFLFSSSLQYQLYTVVTYIIHMTILNSVLWSSSEYGKNKDIDNV